MMYWRCGCGKVELEISGEPWSVGNCHCHSCVASSRFLDEKYQGEKNHTSAIASGGSSGAFFNPNDVKILTEELPPMGCLKVGKDGKAVRKYCKCCGTQFGTVMPGFWGLNRNALYTDEEGKEKWIPKKQITNSMMRFSFNPEEVPEPSYSIGPMKTIFGLIVAVINPFGQRTDKEVMKKFDVEASEVEEVPITWE